MKEPYISVVGIAQCETSKAFCIRSANYALDGIGTTQDTDFWIPLSAIMEDSHDVIEEAARGDEVEIFVAKWFLQEQ